MARIHLLQMAALFVLCLCSHSQADDKPTKRVTPIDQIGAIYHAIYVDTMTEPRARVREFFENTTLETRDLTKKMTLAQFLTAVEKKAANNTFKIRFDADALGKALAPFAAATVECKGLGEKAQLKYLVQIALTQAASQVGSELDYAIRRDGILITWPRLAAYKAVYDLRKIFGPNPLAVFDPRVVLPNEDSRPNNDQDDLLRIALLTTLRLRPWESVELANGTKFVVNASTEKHGEFIDLVDQLRRLADLALVMNARVIEVDREFFNRHVAPLFVKGPDGGEPAAIALVPEALFNMLVDRKSLMVSEDIKFFRGRESVFLSRDAPIRSYKTQNDSGLKAIEGFSFKADFRVTADRRYVRLRISRQVDQLMGMKKDKVQVSGRDEVEIGKPDVHRSTVAGTVQIPDGAAILMRCGYRPISESSKDSVWLMLARPYIWIDAEMNERGVKNIGEYSKRVWTEDFFKYDERPTATEAAPLTDKSKEVLQAVLTDVLTNPRLKHVRDFYGMAGSTKLVLSNHGNIAWPKDFKPDSHGYELVESKPDPFANRPHVLGIRVGQFETEPPDAGQNDNYVEIEIFNAGGSANGVVAGTTHLLYSLVRVKNHWTVKLAGFSDP